MNLTIVSQSSVIVILMINTYVQDLLETCILCSFLRNIGCYDWNVVSESQVKKNAFLNTTILQIIYVPSLVLYYCFFFLYLLLSRISAG
jgi:hypothetical protein